MISVLTNVYSVFFSRKKFFLFDAMQSFYKQTDWVNSPKIYSSPSESWLSTMTMRYFHLSINIVCNFGFCSMISVLTYVYSVFFPEETIFFYLAPFYSLYKFFLLYINPACRPWPSASLTYPRHAILATSFKHLATGYLPTVSPLLVSRYVFCHHASS